MAPERLQKVLASAGIASRRDCEVLISEGRVVVNGEVVSVAGTRVDPDVDTILVDGKPLGARQPRTYIMFHKPVGVVSTTEDPQGRPTVIDLVEVPQRLHLVGRLDFASEGLMLLTDDGALTQALTHPSNQVEKEYRVLLNDTPSADDLRDWRNGVELPAVEDETADNDNYDGADGEEATITTAPAWVEVIERTDSGTWVRVVLHEGRKRQIRRVATALGYDVLRLIRMREGPIMLGDLAAGAWRALTEDEIEKLQQHADRAESMARLIAAQKAKAAAKNAPKAPSDTPSAEEQDEIAPRGNRRDERPSHEIALRAPSGVTALGAVTARSVRSAATAPKVVASAAMAMHRAASVVTVTVRSATARLVQIAPKATAHSVHSVVTVPNARSVATAHSVHSVVIVPSVRLVATVPSVRSAVTATVRSVIARSALIVLTVQQRVARVDPWVTVRHVRLVATGRKVVASAATGMRRAASETVRHVRLVVTARRVVASAVTGMRRAASETVRHVRSVVTARRVVASAVTGMHRAASGGIVRAQVVSAAKGMHHAPSVTVRHARSATTTVRAVISARAPSAPTTAANVTVGVRTTATRATTPTSGRDRVASRNTQRVR